MYTAYFEKDGYLENYGTLHFSASIAGKEELFKIALNGAQHFSINGNYELRICKGVFFSWEQVFTSILTKLQVHAILLSKPKVAQLPKTEESAVLTLSSNIRKTHTVDRLVFTDLSHIKTQRDLW